MVHPTLAGLLCLGSYPQQFFPQLFMSFVSIPSTELGVPGQRGERFLDKQSLDGPVPVILAEALAALQRNMNKAAAVRGLWREDRFDYPVEVLRELLVNAIMHRDCSPAARGTQIQVELYADRLVVRSPWPLRCQFGRRPGHVRARVVVTERCARAAALRPADRRRRNSPPRPPACR